MRPPFHQGTLKESPDTRYEFRFPLIAGKERRKSKRKIGSTELTLCTGVYEAPPEVMLLDTYVGMLWNVLE